MRKTLRLGLFSTLAAGVLSAAYFVNNSTEEAKYQLDSRSMKSAQGYAEYMNMLKANPATGKVELEDVANARKDLQNRAAFKTTALGLSWSSKGPDNAGGRTRAFLIDQSNGSTMYMGSVSGGLFKSTTSGSSWTPIGDDLGNLIISSICQTTNGDIYYGTGENYFSFADGQGRSAFWGGGIYKSTDGINFSVLSSTVPSNAFTDFGDITFLKAHPTDPNTIWAATNRGLERTTDGGLTWEDCLPNRRVIITDMNVDKDGGVWVNSNGEAWYSSDGTPNSFTEITKEFPGQNDLPRSENRMRIETAPSDANYVYAVQIAAQTNLLAGIYRSKDKGQTWTLIGEHTNTWDPFGQYSWQNGWTSGQGRYDLALAVDPLDKDHIYVGGIGVWEWSPTLGWLFFSNNVFDAPLGSHADNHQIEFDPSNPKTMYILSDGGLAVSTDRMTFTERNKNYNTVQFYAIGLGKHHELIGGSQDQGTRYNDGSGNTPESAIRMYGGDGGYSEVSWLDPNVLMSSIPPGTANTDIPGSPGADIFRTNNKGQTWETTSVDKMNKDNRDFVTPYRLHESTVDSNSIDSTEFLAFPSVISRGFGNGLLDTFEGYMPRPQESSIFIAETFVLAAGADTVYSDANGVLYGGGTGTFDASTGYYDVKLNTAPVAEVILVCEVRYNAGDKIYASSAINGLLLPHILPVDLDPFDSLKILDPVQAFVVYGFRGAIWMSRDIHKFGSDMEFWKIGSVTGTPISMRIDEDGDVVYVGTGSGRAYQFSNLSAARDAWTAEEDSADYKVIKKELNLDVVGTRAVTDFASDPNNPNRLVVTIGGYGPNLEHVKFTSNAKSANPTFIDISGDLPSIPVYSAVIDKGNGQRVLLGTEHGIFATDNLVGGATKWSEENNGFARVPVFELEQYRINDASTVECRDSVINDSTSVTICDTNFVEEGAIYLGAHGRGWYVNTDYITQRPISIDEDEIVKTNIKKKEFLKIYPNPAIDYTNVEVKLNVRSDISIDIIDLNGRTVKTMKVNALPQGIHNIRVELNGLSTGNYVMNLNVNGSSKSSTFIVTK